MSTAIRAATNDDATALARIDVVTWSPAVTPAPAPEHGAAFFEHGRQPEDVLVAVVDGVVAGYVLTGRDVPLPCADHVLDLKGLAIDPEFQRRGLGTLLIEAAIRDAQQRGIRRVKSRVLSSNEASLRLHEACGFEVEGRLRGEFVLGGIHVDDVLLARTLGVRDPD